MNAPDLADVLAEVNRLRAERGMDPLDAMPKGARNDADECPLSLALEATGGVGLHDYGTEEVLKVMLPPTLCEFVAAFDRDAYPDLVA